MATYGTCECAACYVRIPKNEAYKVSIEGQSGRSGGSWRFYSGGKNSYSTGRAYYSKKEVWLCGACHAAYQKKLLTRNAIGAVVLVVLAVWFFASTGNKTPNSDETSHTQTKEAYRVAPTSNVQSRPSQPTAPSNPAVNAYRALEQPDQSGAQKTMSVSLQLTDVESVTRVQTRLAELGYLVVPANGIWGPKSRAALKAFKIANGLPPDDRWDQITAGRLFGSAQNAPLDLAPRSANK